MEDADIVPVDGWYRLAAAVVGGLPADDPERKRWLGWGVELRERLNAAPVVPMRRGGLPPGHMIAEYAAPERSSPGPGRRRPRTQG